MQLRDKGPGFGQNNSKWGSDVESETNNIFSQF